jgi:hypothetical protein
MPVSTTAGRLAQTSEAQRQASNRSGLSSEVKEAVVVLHKALYGEDPHGLTTLVDAHSLLNRMRTEIGLSAGGDGSHAGVLRSAQEAKAAVGV